MKINFSTVLSTDKFISTQNDRAKVGWLLVETPSQVKTSTRQRWCDALRWKYSCGGDRPIESSRWHQDNLDTDFFFWREIWIHISRIQSFSQRWFNFDEWQSAITFYKENEWMFELMNFKDNCLTVNNINDDIFLFHDLSKVEETFSVDCLIYWKCFFHFWWIFKKGKNATQI